MRGRDLFPALLCALVVVMAAACNTKTVVSGYCDVKGQIGPCAIDGSAGADGGKDAVGDTTGDAPTDAPARCTPASCTGTTPICNEASGLCQKCSVSANDCAGIGADGGTSVCASSGACVECTTSSDCTFDPTKPICDTIGNAATDAGAAVAADTCRKCEADSECSGPGVCMTDGHCAGTDEVVFVQFDNGGCPGATGSNSNPYCMPNDGAAHLSATSPILVIVGAADGQLTLDTKDISPTVIGRQIDSTGPGSIPATVSTAISILSDNVLIRDLEINSGTAAISSKGIAVSGASTHVTLERVTVKLGTGLGIDAESAGELDMDSCTVSNCSQGGILLNDTPFNIQNTTVSNNGPGQQLTTFWGGIFASFSGPTPDPAALSFVTIQNNGAPGLICTSAIDGNAVFAIGNSTSDVSATCGFTSCSPALAGTCGASP